MPPAIQPGPMAARQSVDLLRDAAIATAILAAVYGLAARYQPSVLVFPYYFLVVGFDVLEVAFGAADEYRPVLIGAYLLALGTITASVLHLVRAALARRSEDRVEGTGAAGSDSEPSGVRIALAAPLLAVALLALLFAVVLVLTTAQRGPAGIAGVVGVCSLGLAALVSGLPQRALRSLRVRQVRQR